jgi:integrase
LRDLHGAGKASGIVFKSSKSGAVLSNWDRVTKAIQAKTKTAGWHRHDLRRTGATVLAELQTAPHIIEQILNHKQTHTRIAAVYDRSKRRAETKAALQLLADHYFDLAKR